MVPAALRRKSKLSLALGLWLVTNPGVRAAVPLTTARIGAGPSIVQTPDKKIQTWGSFGTFRLGAYQERLQLIAGLDLTAWRLQDVPKTTLNYDVHGNDVLFFLGYAQDSWNLWVGIGAGQMRIYDRDAPDEKRPHNSIHQAMEAGASYDLYRATYGKIDSSLTWSRRMPEKDWRSRYALTMIDCLEFEIGFKLMGW